MKNSVDLVSVLNNFLIEEGLFDQKLLLMVSGGVDSMVLFDVALKILPVDQVAVFHLNHNVRHEAEVDALFVQNICSELNIKYYTETLQSTPDQNQESHWRTERKHLSAKAATDFSAARTLTAHHATDLVETMLFRLTKGAGPSGLAPFDTHTKPFWQISKTDLIEYARANNVVWREDPTNQDTKHQRNLIRHQVLPALREITPNLEKVFVREAQLFSDLDAWLQQSIPSTDIPLSLSDFQMLPKVLQQSWLRELSGGTPSLSEIEDAQRWLQGDPPGNSVKNLGPVTLIYKNAQISLQ